MYHHKTEVSSLPSLFYLAIHIAPFFTTVAVLLHRLEASGPLWSHVPSGALVERTAFIAAVMNTVYIHN